MIGERPFVRIAGNLLRYDGALLHTGARPTHALQRCLRGDLAELALARLSFRAEQRNGRLPFARLLAAHARTLHLPDLASGYLWGPESPRRQNESFSTREYK